MSFVSGIETAITNFFSSASDAFSGVVNFGSNILNGVQNAVQGTIHTLANVAQSIYNGLLTIGNDIVNIFGQLGGAIWHALVSSANVVGSFFYSAFHVIASALYGLGQRIANAFEFVAKWMWSSLGAIGTAIHNFGNWLYAGIHEVAVIFAQISQIFVNVISYIQQVAVTIWNYLVDAFNGLVNALNGFVSDIKGFAEDVITYLEDAYNFVAGIPNDVAKYITSRVSAVAPRLVEYNLFFEQMKAMDRLAEAMSVKLEGGGFKSMLLPLLVKVSSPIFAWLTSHMAGAVVASLFPEITSVQQHTLTPLPPTPRLSTSVSVTNPLTKVSSAMTTGQITTPQQASIAPPSLTTFERYVVGVKEVDAIYLTGYPTAFNTVKSPYPNSSTVEDQLSISGSIVINTVPSLTSSFADIITPLPYAKLSITTVQETDNINVEFAGGISVATVIEGIPICQLPSSLPPGQQYQPTDTIQGNMSICIEVLTTTADYATFGVSEYYNTLNPPTPEVYQQTDTLVATASTYTGSSPP